jgi:hypothetical protein
MLRSKAGYDLWMSKDNLSHGRVLELIAVLLDLINNRAFVIRILKRPSYT